MSAIDPFSKEYGTDLANPASRIMLITPNDNNDVEPHLKSFRVYNGDTVSANVKVTTVKGDTVVLPFPPGLTVETLRVKRIWATNTTAGLTIHGYTD